MMFRIFALLCLAQSCLTVIVTIQKEVDCSGHCACCEGGTGGCGLGSTLKDICHAGCVGTIYGTRCKYLCPLNCATCNQWNGTLCFSCKDSFYDIKSACSMSCPPGCDGPCRDDGNCRTCKSSLEGAKCNVYIPRKYGDDCSMISINIALVASMGVWGIVLICTVAGCYLWNRLMSKSKERNKEIQLDQRETERRYEELQRQNTDPTYRNTDDKYNVLAM